MSNERAMGLLWGFNIGMALGAGIFVHPLILAFCPFFGWCCYSFGRRPGQGERADG